MVLRTKLLAIVLLLGSCRQYNICWGTEKALTLPDVVHLALSQNPSLKRASEQIILAKSRYQQEWAALLPNLVARAEQRHYRLYYLTGNRSTLPAVELNVTLSGQQPFFIREAHCWYNAAILDQQATLQTILAQVINAYFDALETRLLAFNAELGIAEAKQQLELTKDGKHGGEDLSRAESQFVQQQRRLTTANNRQAQTLQALRNVLNLAPETSLLLDHTGPLTPFKLLNDTEDDAVLLNQLRQTQPVLLRLKAEQRALENQVLQEKNQWLPKVTGKAYWGGLGPSLAQQTYVRDAGVSVEMTLLEHMGTHIPLLVAEKQATVRQKQAELMEAQRRLETDFVQSRLDAKALLENLSQTTQEKKLAEQNYRQTLERYQKGRIPFVTVTDAQESFINARNNFVQTLFNYNRAHVRQVQSIGRLVPDLFTQKP